MFIVVSCEEEQFYNLLWENEALVTFESCNICMAFT